MVDTVIVENEQSPTSAVSWPAVFAGAVVTAALSLLLLALGSGIGFSVMNPWGSAPTASETTKAATVAGIYFTVTAVIASAVGGYLTGRLRALWLGMSSDESFFRDTAHGLVAWAVATVATAAFLGSAGTVITGGAATGAAHGAVAVQARDGAFPALTDRLFTYDYVAVSKQQGGQPYPGIARDYAGDRAAADRLLGRSAFAGRALTDDERQNLAIMVANRTGMALPDAEKRVAAIEADARRAAETARRVGMMPSFWLVAAMLAGALASSLAAWEGGAIRDGRLKYGR
jgi:hypothetical protein